MLPTPESGRFEQYNFSSVEVATVCSSVINTVAKCVGADPDLVLRYVPYDPTVHFVDLTEGYGIEYLNLSNPIPAREKDKFFAAAHIITTAYKLLEFGGRQGNVVVRFQNCSRFRDEHVLVIRINDSIFNFSPHTRMILDYQNNKCYVFSHNTNKFESTI